MLFRNCAGGVVFHDKAVFLLKNDKGEWVLPKGLIRKGEVASETALKRVGKEAGIKAEIIDFAGETVYEFYSQSRQRPVNNKISWFLMVSPKTEYKVAEEEGFLDGGFYPIEKAVEMITYSQDKALVRIAYEKYKKINLSD